MLVTHYGVNFEWILHILFKKSVFYFSDCSLKEACSSVSKASCSLSKDCLFKTHALHFSFALFYYIFPKIRPILFKESWFTNFSQLLPSRAIFRQNNWATADILHIVPSMSNFVKFFGSLLKTTVLVCKCCDFHAKKNFELRYFITTQTTVLYR